MLAFQENKNKKILDKIRNIAEGSSIHALPNISRNEFWIIKIIWILSFLAGLGYCSYGLTKSFGDYFSYAVNTQISNQRLSSIEFPTITFCNNNPFNLYEESAIKTVFNYYKNLFVDYVLVMNDTLTLMAFLEIATKVAPTTLNLSDMEKSKISFNIDDMLVNCRFNNFPCFKEEFEYFYTPYYGNCYKFNSGKSLNGSVIDKRKTSSPGRRNSFKLELFTGYPSEDNDLIRSNGFKLYVHNSSSIPLTDVDGVSISPGFETDLVVKQVFYNKQPQPYGDCIINVNSKDSYDSFLFRSTIDVIGKYQQKICLQLCYQKFLLSRCQCYDVTTLSYNLTRPCNDGELSGCVYPAYVYFYSTDSASECFQSCPEECNSIIYNLQLSQSDFPSPFYSNALIKYAVLIPNTTRKYTSHQEVKSSVAAVNIYFDDIAYTVIDEVPAKTSEQLFADIGGFMGLCIGTSLLSFVEIIELALEILFVYFSPENTVTDIKPFKF